MSAHPSITALVCQLNIPADMRSIGEQVEHLDRTAQLLDDALTRKRADVVVLPELSSVSYTRYCFSHLDTFGEEEGGRTFEVLSRVAKKHGVFLLYGAPRVTSEGSAHISQFLIDAAGNARGVYDKLHMAQFGASMEKDYFTRGEKILVFDIKGVRLAPVICYDMRFPELAMNLVREYEVHAVIHPVAFFRDASFYSWQAFVIARALENQAYWLSINRAGSDFGASIVCPPWVDETSKEIIKETREKYSFSLDKLEDYSKL